MTLSDLRGSLAAIGRESWLLFIALSIANGTNYVFHVAISRYLGPEDYGALGSVLAILLVLSIPVAAIQTSVAKRIASVRASASPGEPAEEWGSALRSVIPLSIGATAALVLASPILTSFLRLDSWWTAFYVCVYVLPTMLTPVLTGTMQGMMRFKDMAVVHTIGALLRLALGLMMVRAGGGVPGAVAASAIAQFVMCGLALWLVNRTLPLRRRPSRAIGAFLKEARPVASGLAALWILIELDLILARHFLSPGDSGEYAAAGLLARAILFIPSVVSLIALPHFTELRERGREAFRWLLACSGIVVALGGAAAIVLMFADEAAIHLTFGERFAGAAGLLVPLSLAMIFLSLTNLLLMFHIAVESKAHRLLWGLAVTEAVMIALFHDSPMIIALNVLVVAGVAAVGGFAMARSLSLFQRPMAHLPSDLSVFPSKMSGTSSPDLSLVVPSYNVTTEMEAIVRRIDQSLQGSGKTYEVIVVSDGSGDGWTDALDGMLECASVLHYPQQHGKGVALRVGMAHARGRFVAFIDSDGDLEPAELGNFLALVDLYDPDLIVGSKRHPLSEVEYPPLRRAMSWTYQRIVRLLFGLNLRDTQTGMKLIRRDVLDAVLPRLMEKRFALDLEFLVVARRLGYRRVFEAPVKIDYKFDSTVDIRAVLRILLDTGAIFYRRYLLRFYDRPSDEVVVPDAAPGATPMNRTVQRVAG